MTLSDIQFPVAYDWASSFALVFNASLAARLAEVQAEYGDRRHVPNPRLLADGRFMLAADVLTECVPGGIVYGGFSHLDPTRFSDIEVVPLEQALALLPPNDPMG